MACNTTRQNCPPSSVFSAMASPKCSQFANPANFQAEQFVYSAAFRDSINNFGIPVDYYINTFNINTADNLYGEQPTAVFYGPISLMMYVELSENAINLSRFGFASDDEMTGFLHIQTFTNSICGKEYFIQTSAGEIITVEEYTDLFNLTYVDKTLLQPYLNSNQAVEPKSGDLIQLSPLGCDRPNGRGAKIFEVTERMDQDVSSINPMLGHYVYRLRAKRYGYSFEPGAPQEPQNQQVFENAFSGKISSTIPGEVPSDPKSYTGNVDTESQTKVFDMTANDTDIYGTYY